MPSGGCGRWGWRRRRGSHGVRGCATAAQQSGGRLRGQSTARRSEGNGAETARSRLGWRQRTGDALGRAMPSRLISNGLGALGGTSRSLWVPPPPPRPSPPEGRRRWTVGISRALRSMARAATLRGLMGIAAAGGRRVRACGERLDAGWRGFRAGASGGRAAPRSSSSSASAAARKARPLRGAAAAAGNKGWVSGGFESEDGRLTCGYSSYKGRRPTMEDCYDIKLTKIAGQPVSLFGVFDGHAGNLAAEYLKENLFKNLIEDPELLTDTKLAIRGTFLETDEDIIEIISHSYRDDGSTALAAVVIGKRLYVANVGDSRAVASIGGKAVPLSKDHKPNMKDERKRIEDAGGVVIHDDTWRVGGILAMSRAFGNRLLKQYVKAEPDIQEQELKSDLQYLILATDGLWDVVRNEDAISLLKGEDGPEAASVKLTEIAYARHSTDNITCIVVQFHHEK